MSINSTVFKITSTAPVPSLQKVNYCIELQYCPNMAITSDSWKENIVEDKLANENFSNESASRGQKKKEIVLPRESRVKKTVLRKRK